MTSIKAYKVDDFLRTCDLSGGIFLFFGPDAGLVAERGRHLSERAARKQKTEIIPLTQSEMDETPDRLLVLAMTDSLFGPRPVIRIGGADGKLLPALEPLLNEPSPPLVVLEAANLTPRDKLRGRLEKAPNAWTLPCYADDQRTLNHLIEQTFANEGIAISREAKLYLGEILGNDREITRRELEKLVCFALQDKKLSLPDVQNLCADNAMVTMDRILDATGTGQPAELEKQLTRGLESGLDPQLVLISLNRHFLMLREAAASMTNGASPATAMQGLRPRPHFSRKNAIQTQLTIWNPEMLEKALADIFRATRDSRTTPLLAETLTRRLLLGLCQRAARQHQRTSRKR